MKEFFNLFISYQKLLLMPLMLAPLLKSKLCMYIEMVQFQNNRIVQKVGHLTLGLMYVT